VPTIIEITDMSWSVTYDIYRYIRTKLRLKCVRKYLHQLEWEHQWIHSYDWTTSTMPWARQAIQSSVHCSRRWAQRTDKKCHSTYDTYTQRAFNGHHTSKLFTFSPFISHLWNILGQDTTSHISWHAVTPCLSWVAFFHFLLKIPPLNSKILK